MTRLLVLVLAAGPAFGEDVTLSANYPSAVGVYREMIATRRATFARDGGTVTIGRGPAFGKLTLIGDGSPAALVQSAGGGPSVAAELRLERSRGTPSSPAPVQPGDELGSVRAYAFDGSGWIEAAGMSIKRDAGAGPGVPGRLELLTNPGGAAGAEARLTILSNGWIGIGSAAADPKAPLDIGHRGWLATQRVSHPDGPGGAGDYLSLSAEDSTRISLFGGDGSDDFANPVSDAIHYEASLHRFQGRYPAGAAAVGVHGRMAVGTAGDGYPGVPPAALTILGGLCVDRPSQNCPANRDGEIQALVAANGFDAAERFEPWGELEPGDVASAADRPGAARRSDAPMDPRVLGVVSEEPGLILGSPGTGVPVAMAGRVRVKVSDENGPIEEGDWLVASSSPGVAMRADSPRPGTALGKALQCWPSGRGRIRMLVRPR